MCQQLGLCSSQKKACPFGCGSFRVLLVGIGLQGHQSKATFFCFCFVLKEHVHKRDISTSTHAHTCSLHEFHCGKSCAKVQKKQTPHQSRSIWEGRASSKPGGSRMDSLHQLVARGSESEVRRDSPQSRNFSRRLDGNQSCSAHSMGVVYRV